MVLNRTHLAEFAAVLAKARKITVLTGAGVSAESGIPTFRGEGGLWRTWSATDLATPEAFRENPSLVWEFYHYRRCIVSKAFPNASHYALAALQQRCKQEGKNFKLLTQNIDGLHMQAGSTEVVELHGSLWKTRCCHCGDVQENREMPICAALDGKGAPDTKTPDARIPVMQLPRCNICNGLLRPHVVWFGENLEEKILRQVDEALNACGLLLVAGTSSVVYPAAGYAPLVSALGGVVAEFNIDDTPASRHCKFKFRGPSATTLPEALGIPLDQLPQVTAPSDGS
ncbi:hypothetical protein R1flu_021942 [Riccia fluitans]|uniref:NAD-dependent protein deacylase n=1 Tax=Riccia fluitans TaxID=41844 RepID=A0ABD1ZTR9_9MARC